MLKSMSARELVEWRAFYQIEPFGEERADIRSAISTAAIVNQLRINAHMWTKKGTAKPEMAKFEDFMPFAEKATPEPEVVSMTPQSRAEMIKAKLMGNPFFNPNLSKKKREVIRK